MAHSVERTDVLVVGAGPAGSAAAYWLAQRGVDVLLVDQHDFPRDKACGDGLTPRAVSLLGELGVLERLPAGQSRVNRGGRFYAPSGRSAVLRFATNAEGLPDWGLVVRRQVLDSLLLEAAIGAGARFVSGFRAGALVNEGSSACGVPGERGGKSLEIRATLTVVATGANVRFLKASGLAPGGLPRALAVRAYFENVRGLDEYINVYFSPGPPPGYAWIFPESASTANVGVGFFLQGRDSARADLRGMLDRFVRTDPRARERLADARMVGTAKGSPLRVSFPMGPVHAAGVLLAGEAAGLVNPLTGDGVAYALGSGRLAADAAARALESGDVSESGLAAYRQALDQAYRPLFTRARQFRQRFTRRLPLEALILLGKIGYRPNYW